MANINSINGNPIVIGTSGISDGAVTDAKLAQTGGVLDSVHDISETLSDVLKGPDNYGEISADDMIVGTSALIGRVTAVDNPSGGIDLTNSSGVNGHLGFALPDLAYGTTTKYDVRVTLSGYKTPVHMYIRGTFSQGSYGAVLYTLENIEDDVYGLDEVSVNLANVSMMYFSFELRYNQSTPVNINLEITKSTETGKVFVNPSALTDIEMSNLSDSLRDVINSGGGSTPTTYGGRQFTTFNKGVAIGDSLTAGVFNHNEGGTTAWITNQLFSYPAKLQQLSGVNVTNLGNGGYTSDQWLTAHANDDFSGYQFAIIQLGVNDTIQYEGWTQTSIDAFTSIINKLLSDASGIFVFVSTIIPTMAYTTERYVAVSQGIRELVASINNSHVILLDMAAYGNTADEVGYNNGHLSALGYDRLAQDYMAYISYVMSQNPTLFRNIQFIGTSYDYS